jgi:peptidyl-prolyl cis-trans isomerase B (cyclophilin B)
MKKIIALILVSILCLSLLCSCGKSEGNEETYGKPYTAGINIDTTGHTLHQVEITIKNYGIIQLTLDETLAPITVQNFLKLANEGFYDGLTLHRIIDGFMIQGGDPKGNGTGGSKDTIKGEFAYNGVKNDLSHVRGVISMARQGENPYYGITAEMANNSASSQFFIMHKDVADLNGQYAAFGWVTGGIEFVDQICADTPVEDRNGTVLAKNQPVIVSVRVVSEES